MAISPIETRYAGCRFRSRLEARWAVFFDHLGIGWEYEPQGFVIDGRPYLPDFLLTTCGTWIEVKGNPADLDTRLMISAARQLPVMPYRCEPGPQLMILGSIPEPAKHGDWGWVGIDTTGDHSWNYGFANFHKNLRPWALCNAQGRYDKDNWLIPTCDRYEDPRPADEAYAAARSARFEHGENGQ